MPPYKLAWFRDPDFRRAVLIGLDRPGLVKAVYFGRAQPLDAIISPVNPKWHNPDTVRYPYDPEQAKALLEQSGSCWAPTVSCAMRRAIRSSSSCSRAKAARPPRALGRL